MFTKFLSVGQTQKIQTIMQSVSQQERGGTYGASEILVQYKVLSFLHHKRLLL